MRSRNASSTQSTTVDIASAFLYDMVGKAISVNGTVLTVTGQHGTSLTCEPLLARPRRRPKSLTPHADRGHSFWPDKDRLPSVYRCSRCGAEKGPGQGFPLACGEVLAHNVDEVHNL